MILKSRFFFFILVSSDFANDTNDSEKKCHLHLEVVSFFSKNFKENAGLQSWIFLLFLSKREMTNDKS